MAFILHIETSTPTCSVAISEKSEILSVRESHVDKSHAELLAVFIQELFEETGINPNNLNAVSVSKGPGSYTGLRIGVSTAKGLVYGLNIPLISVNTLEAMAWGMLNSEELKSIEQPDNNNFLCPMIDARRMEVYTALFNSELKVLSKTSALIIDNESFKDWLDLGKICFFGNGAFKCKGTIHHKNAIFMSEFNNSSRYMADLAFKSFEAKDFEDVAYFDPYYLKDFIPTIPKNKIIRP